MIIVSAGTNDGAEPLDELATAMSKATPPDLDATNLYEGARWVFWTIRETWPRARCFAGLPIQRADYPPETKAAWYDAIRFMALANGCAVIDATYQSGIDYRYEVWEGEGRYLYDGIHPNEAGQRLMADLYASSVR